MGFNDTWTPGLVDFIEDRELIDSHLKGPLDQLRETMLKSYEPNKLTSQTEFNAICLLQLSDPAINASNLIRVKARIPELHVMLPIPAGSTSAADLRTISLYPTYTGLKTDFNPQITPNSIQPGTRLTVSYENHSNFSGPAIVRVSDIRVAGSPPTGGSGGSGGTGGGSTPGTSSSSTSRHRAGGWYWVTKPALKAGTVDLVKLTETNGVIFRRQGVGRDKRKFQHGVPRMQEFFNGLRAATPMAGNDINSGGGSSITIPVGPQSTPFVFKQGWYIADVARSTGGPFGGTPDTHIPPITTGRCSTSAWCKHSSHQSGIDVDMSIPQLVDANNRPLRSAPTAVNPGLHGMSAKAYRHTAGWAMRPVTPTNIDVMANLQFLLYCVDFCDQPPPNGRRLRPAAYGGRYSTVGGKTTGGVFLDKHLIAVLKAAAVEARDDTSHTLNSRMTPDIFRRIFGGTLDGKSVRGFLIHVPGHANHYHVRLNTIGFNDKNNNYSTGHSIPGAKPATGGPGNIDVDADRGLLAYPGT